MAKYNVDGSGFLYQESGNPSATLYGQTVADPSRSVEPFIAVPIDYDSVSVSWKIPYAKNRRFRLTRNQDGIPDSSEEGVILIDTYENSRTAFLDDGSEVPLVPGKHVYYSIWIWLSDTVGEVEQTEWFLCGVAQTIVPSNHSTEVEGIATPTTHERMVDLLPRVLTTYTDDTQSLGALDVPDYDSRLYSDGVTPRGSDIVEFIRAMALTADEVMTYADLLIPNADFSNLTPDLLDAVDYNYGLPQENRLSTANQKHLTREIMRIYREKGTMSGLSTFVESLTGFSTSITTSPNLMLSVQDSTFYHGVGNWTTNGVSGITLSVATPGAPTALTTEAARRVDNTYVGQVVVDTSDTKISLGNSNVIHTAIPVKDGEYYTFSFYQKKPVGSGTYTLGVTWYDYLGKQIGSEAVSSTIDATTTWSKINFDKVIAPEAVYSGTTKTSEKAAYAGLSIKFGATGAYFLDMIQVSTAETADDYITEYYEPRGVEISLEPNKYNYVANPSFEVNTSLWTGVNTGSVTKELLTTAAGIIPGQYSGKYAAKVTSTSSAAVSMSTTASEVISSGGDYTFSAHVESAEVPTLDEDNLGYKGRIEVYAVSPYSNFVDNPTPTGSGTATGWSFSPGTSGAATTSYETVAGSSAIKYTISTAPSAGELILTLGTDGITEAIHESAEYVFRAYVYSTRDVEIIPSVIWGYDGGTVDVTAATRSSGDETVTLDVADADTLFSVDDVVVVEDTGDATVDGTWTITAVDSTTVTYESTDPTAVALTELTTATIRKPGTVVEDSSPANITAGEWTPLEWTSIAPFESSYVSFTLSADATGFVVDDYMAFHTAEVGYMTYSNSSDWIGVDGTWRRHSTSIALPTDIVLPYDKNGLSADMSISWTSNGTAVYIDAVQLEPRYVATDYFDGSFVDGEWEGTAHASVSQFYTNVDAKLARLRQEITKYIPLGIPYYVTVNNSIALSGTFKGYA